ncbi:M14 family zinc carboxypeptidase [Colwellia psychrerythraea]|uniref:Peptidase M14 carboxypeptidase A n=1 Tax=Colwellia psychrerythraea TaxID=28229 RepID=A0A099L5K8_COLPS|nr:M14 family zinc carboxypeptidase [Colwellia psychrerythraea]KGJ97462.1 peptidase M14 carboxypeptidase A [Colwellia psychrerythraea]
MLLIRILIISFTLFCSTLVPAKPVQNYLPTGIQFNKEIPLPSSTLGFEIGQRHVRHDQLTNYFYSLANHSDRVKLTSMGKTPQQREQLLVTISSPQNLENLANILSERDLFSKSKKQLKQQSSSNAPLVIWLGYSVHGDEISGANAAMIVAYYLAANNDKKMAELLANTVIVLEPSINPDGMDRFVNWVNTYRNSSDNSDANHIEHHQNWVTGRTNHFWFDLNRDWLLLSQQESQHRLKYFHQYQPHVVGDFHEMGHNSSYFFQPGIQSRTHPLTPKRNVELTTTLATFHAAALDKQQRLYYSEENFDDFYYGKGSTYPDINGSIGVLFEQASPRGMQQETVNGLLTLEFSIENHVTTSLSTINGAWVNRNQLKQYRSDFYQQSNKLAEKEDFSGYLLHESKDNYRLNALLSKLIQHKIKVYALTTDFEFNDKNYQKGTSYYVPLAQPQFRLIQALFNQQTNFKDNTFYDVSGWTMPLAMNIESIKINRTRGLKLAKQAWSLPASLIKNSASKLAYAYIFEWHHFLAPKLLNQLLASNIKARVATKPFSSLINGKEKHFKAGSIVIPAGIQKNENWQAQLIAASNSTDIYLESVTTGLTMKGVDIGSSSIKPLYQPKAMLLGGMGISQYEAGEVRFYLDETLNIPLSIIDHSKLRRVDLSTYSHIILVDGNYQSVAEHTAKQLKHWVKNGGVIIGQKRAAVWLAKQEILRASFVSKEQINQLFDHENLNYQDKEKLASRKRIAGAIFQVELDTSHPLAYGYQQSLLPVFRDNNLIMEQPKQPFVTLAQYTPTPLLSGYTDKNLVNRLAHNAAIVAHNVGKGRVIATTEVLAFRGYWYGSAKLLANSLFFSKAFSAPYK